MVQRQTYYAFLNEALQPGYEGEINLDDFDVVVNEVSLIDKLTNNPITVKCKTLYAKRP